MEQKERVFVRGSWCFADSKLFGYEHEGVVPERVLTAKELLASIQSKIAIEHPPFQPVKPDTLEELINDALEDDRLDLSVKPAYHATQVSVRYGNPVENLKAGIQCSGYQVLNKTGVPIFLASSDGQSFQLPHHDTSGAIQPYGNTAKVVLFKTITYHSTASLRVEFTSLSQLRESSGLSQWKEQLYQIMCKLDTDNALTVNWLNPMHFTIEYVMDLASIKKYGAIYDPHTELTFTAHSLGHAVKAHPGYSHERTRQVVKAHLASLDQNQTQVIRIVVKSQPDKIFYQRLNGVVQSLGCITDTPKPSVVNMIVGDKNLEEYIEIYVKSKSTYIRDGSVFRQLNSEEDAVLLHRYSIEDAIERHLIFATPEQADAFGDVKGREERLERIAEKEERTKLEAAMQTERLESERKVREANEQRSSVEAQLAELRLKSENEALQLRRQAEELTRAHEREMAELKQKAAQNEHAQRMEIGSSAMRAQESKNSTETLKVIGAVVATVAVVFTAVVKIIPMLSSGLSLVSSLFG